ncbi:hypothetical protein SASPL_150938 [Salvia splendens]|uniref:Uncharacterized protein n=1 Tax=Salvia splendens TaxID=180675 RepID=A0A8X8W7F5_SALSN|nr:hypothetical protein SASPL_150938 [Salvia splendens]
MIIADLSINGLFTNCCCSNLEVSLLEGLKFDGESVAILKSVGICIRIMKKTSAQTKDDKKTVTRTREKKVYSLAGQKFDVPEELLPLLMEHGMLSPERSRKAYEKKQRKQKQLRSGTPIKSPPPSTSSRPESSKRPQPVPKNGEVKSKKRLKEDSDDEDDFVLSHKRRRELSQSILKCSLPRPRIASATRTCNVTMSWNICREEKYKKMPQRKHDPGQKTRC